MKTFVIALMTTLCLAASVSALAPKVSKAVADFQEPALVPTAKLAYAPELPPVLHCPAMIVAPSIVESVEMPAAVVRAPCEPSPCMLNPAACFSRDCASGSCDAEATFQCILIQFGFNCFCN